MQLMNDNLGWDDDEPMDRSRSPSPQRTFAGQVVKYERSREHYAMAHTFQFKKSCENALTRRLFTYPPAPAKGAIAVSNEDLFCLNDGEFLNDVIIDFYLKYISREILKDWQRDSTHIFSSFFYRRLTQKEARRNDDNTLTSVSQLRSQCHEFPLHHDVILVCVVGLHRSVMLE